MSPAHGLEYCWLVCVDLHVYGFSFVIQFLEYRGTSMFQARLHYRTLSPSLIFTLAHCHRSTCIDSAYFHFHSQAPSCPNMDIHPRITSCRCPRKASLLASDTYQIDLQPPNRYRQPTQAPKLGHQTHCCPHSLSSYSRSRSGPRLSHLH